MYLLYAYKLKHFITKNRLSYFGCTKNKITINVDLCTLDTFKLFWQTAKNKKIILQFFFWLKLYEITIWNINISKLGTRIKI